VTLSSYADGESHYLWLELRAPLKKRMEKRSADDKAASRAEKEMPNPEINVRLQWAKESAVSRVQYSGLDSNISVNIDLMSIGVAAVDFNPFLGNPRELIFALIEKINATVNVADDEFQTSLSVTSVQVDNQLPYANNPVTLAPTALRLKHPRVPPKSMTDRLTNRKIGFFHLQLTLSKKEKSMLHVQELLLYMGEMDISVEEYLVDTLINFMLDGLPFLSGIGIGSDYDTSRGWKTYILEQCLHFPDEGTLLESSDDLENYRVRGGRKGLDVGGGDKVELLLGSTNSNFVSSFSSSNNILMTDPREALVHLLENMNENEYSNALVSTSASSSTLSWFYFEYAEVSAVQMNITLTIGAKPKSAPATDKFIATYTTAYGFQLVELDDVAISICGLMFEDALMSKNYLIRLVTRHVIWETIRMAHKILSTVPLVGIPVEAASNLTAAASRAIRPLEELTQNSNAPDDDLARYDDGYVSNTAMTCGAIARSTSASLLRVMQALSTAILKASFRIFGLGSECFALLSLDSEFVALLQRKPASTREAFYMGVREFGLGCGQGTVGLVLLPYQGSVDRDDSCIRGMGLGVLGVITKPISGSLQLVSRSCFAAGRTIEAIGNDRIRSSNILGTRTRDPLRFTNGNAVPIDNDEESKKLEKEHWSNVLVTINNRKYRKEIIVDIGHVTGSPIIVGFGRSPEASRYSQVSIFTLKRIILMSHHQEDDEDADPNDEEASQSHVQVVRWSIQKRHIEKVRVEAEGLRILVYARRVKMAGFGMTLLCNTMMAVYERPIVLTMDTRDHFGEMYRLFLSHCRDAMDEDSVLYTVVHQGLSTESRKTNKEGNEARSEPRSEATADEYTIMGLPQGVRAS